MSAVLWVTALPPGYDLGGGNLRQAHLLHALAERADVHLVVVGRVDDDRVRGRLASLTEVPSPTSSGLEPGLRRSLRHLRHALVDRFPSEVTTHQEVCGRVREIVSAHERRADAVCVEQATLASVLPRHRTIPYSIDLNNLLSGMAEQARVVAPGARQRCFQSLELRKARRFERWITTAYDRVFVVSEEDARALPAAAAVVPNGVDSSAYTPTPVPPSNRILMTGAFYTLPNVDGARWFCEHVLPLVRDRMPGVELDLVGRDPLPEVQGLGGLPGVSVHRDVPSMDPYLARARVTVAPLRIGTGTRLKVLEAMAAARPVVGTTLGLDGLGLVDGEHALFADAPEQFADAVCRVIEDDELANRLAGAGRRHVEARFAWDAIGARFTNLLLDGTQPS